MENKNESHYNVRLRHRTKSNFEIGFIVTGSCINKAQRAAIKRATEEFTSSSAAEWEITHCAVVRQWRLF